MTTLLERDVNEKIILSLYLLHWLIDIDILFLDDLIGDSMHNMPVVVGNTVANVTGSGTANYAHPRSNNAKLTPMHIRSKFGQLGPSKGQFNSPHGFCLGTDEDIIVADTNNHRIQVHAPQIHN